MMEQEIDAAVEWWTNQLQAPAKHDAGDFTINAFASFAGQAAYTPISAEQLALFREALREEVTKMVMKSHPQLDVPMQGAALRCFGTDYNPGVELANAAEKAGIDCFLCFPIKTLMWIDPGHVTVSCGYGAERETIFPGKEAQS